MKASSGTTPFPNVLLDVFMPRLSDTSWRVLCVVVRQTLGWQVSNGLRKRDDWISHGQLKKRTGRQSEAVSRAIQDLLERGLIDVRDEFGRILYRPSDRSQRGARLYFSLSAGLLGLIHTVSVEGFRNAKPTKAKKTKEK